MKIYTIDHNFTKPVDHIITVNHGDAFQLKITTGGIDESAVVTIGVPTSTDGGAAMTAQASDTWQCDYASLGQHRYTADVTGAATAKITVVVNAVESSVRELPSSSGGGSTSWTQATAELDLNNHNVLVGNNSNTKITVNAVDPNTGEAIFIDLDNIEDGGEAIGMIVNLDSSHQNMAVAYEFISTPESDTEYFVTESFNYTSTENITVCTGDVAWTTPNLPASNTITYFHISKKDNIYFIKQWSVAES